MNAIEIKNLKKKYKDFAIENLNFNVPKGSIVGLVGQNGAGKSTTIKLIMDVIKSDEGTVKVLGVDNKSSDFCKLKEQIGVVLDEASFPVELNAKNVNSIMKLTYTNWETTEFNRYMEKFKLPIEKPFKDYSRGMKMKLGIAVAMSHNAKLLILDEATSGLDPMIRDEILEVFNDFTRDENNSILMSSHIISDLEKICDYIAFMQNGSLVLFEEKDSILENYGIIKVRYNEIDDVPKEAIIREKVTSYGFEILVQKKKVSNIYAMERCTLEDIIIFLSKEEN